MKLIDANRLLADLDPFPYVQHAMDSFIEEQPEVEAIPIEYIQKEIEDLERSLDFYGSVEEYDALRVDAMYQHDALTGLVRHWRAERRDK